MYFLKDIVQCITKYLKITEELFFYHSDSKKTIFFQAFKCNCVLTSCSVLPAKSGGRIEIISF